MTIRRRWLLLVCLAVSACSESDVEDPARSDEAATEQDTSMPADVASFFDGRCDAPVGAALERWEAAGYSGAVAVSGPGTVCFEGYGLADDAGQPNTSDTLFDMGSVSKTVTAVAVLTLVDAGVLALQDTVGQLVREFSADKAPITIEQLMTHTAGLPASHGSGDDQPMTEAEAIAAIDSLPLLFAPGSDFAYSNAGYTVLALVVARASGRDFREYVINDVMSVPGTGPAGGFWSGEPAVEIPRATGYFSDGSTGEIGDFPGPHWAIEGAAGMAFTARGLHDWTRALVTGQVLSEATFEEMMRPRVDLDDDQAEALGWLRLGEASLGDAGEHGFVSSGGGGSVGHEALLLWLPESDQVMVMLSNRATINAEQIAMAMLPAVLTDADPIIPTQGIDISAEDLQRRVGEYVLADGSVLELAVADTGLRVGATGSRALAALFPLPEGVDSTAFAEHERQVDLFLNGSTPAGRRELDALADEFGPISSFSLTGSGFVGGEIRTFVDVTLGGQRLAAWLALDEFGSLSALDEQSTPPARRFIALSNEVFAPQVLLPGETPVEIDFGDEAAALQITTGSGSESASMQ